MIAAHYRPKNVELDMLHEIGNRIAAADPLPELLGRVVEVISAVVASDSCFVYVLEVTTWCCGPSKNPHAEVVDRLKLQVGQGITDGLPSIKLRWRWRAMLSRIHGFRSFNELHEDLYQAFLSVPVLSRDKLVGVINLQHRQPHDYSQREIHMISDDWILVGAEIENGPARGRELRAFRTIGDQEDHRARQRNPAAGYAVERTRGLYYAAKA